jgi:hypothetical protein
VVGVVFLNMLPYMDTEAVKLWVEFQTKIYNKLNSTKRTTMMSYFLVNLV